MLGAAVLLASAMAPVSMSQDQQRRLLSSYPTWAVQQGKSAAVLTEAVVEPDGSLRECRVVAFAGNERLANEACATLGRRKLQPARDPDGRPTLGVQRNATTMVLSGRSDEISAVQSWVPPADLIMPVDQLPGSNSSKLDAHIVLFVRVDGTVAACDANIQRNEREDVPAAFVERACAEATKTRQTVRTDRSGQPSDYVTSLTVRFEASPAT